MEWFADLVVGLDGGVADGKDYHGTQCRVYLECFAALLYIEGTDPTTPQPLLYGSQAEVFGGDGGIDIAVVATVGATHPGFAIIGANHDEEGGAVCIQVKRSAAPHRASRCCLSRTTR